VNLARVVLFLRLPGLVSAAGIWHCAAEQDHQVLADRFECRVALEVDQAQVVVHWPYTAAMQKALRTGQVGV
jgi:hypothetical protein